MAPYINEDRRAHFQEFVDQAKHTRIDSAGELNYLLTEIALEYVNQHGMNYRVMNEVIGAMECAKIELYRRKLAPYEDEKKLAHGDVY